jgi:DNA-binding beta-propeller fold protein YncE
LTGLAQLTVESRRKLALPLRGKPTGLSYDPATDRFLVTTELGLYVTDGALERVERHTVVDPMYSVDLARFVDGAFLDDRRVLAISDNKSFVMLKETERGSTGGGDRNFAYFLESYDDFDEVKRSRLATVRAKMMYVMSCVYDPATKSLFTLTVPNAANRQLVVSRFDIADMTLSEEFAPAIAAGAAFAPKQGGPGLEKLYVTAATVEGGKLHALSAAHATLLTIDLAARAVVDAKTIPGLARPVGLASRNGRFHVVTADGELVIVGSR